MSKQFICRIYDEDHALRLEQAVHVALTGLLQLTWGFENDSGVPVPIHEIELYDPKRQQSLVRLGDFGTMAPGSHWTWAWSFGFNLGPEGPHGDTANWRGVRAFNGQEVVDATL